MRVLTTLFGMSDEQAMWRVQMHDDAEAFAHLLNHWEQPIKRLCIRMLGDIHKAEDMTQEAFARVFTRRKDYQHGAKFSTFLWRVAMNLCLDELRRLKRRKEFSVVREDGSENESWEEFASHERVPDTALIAEEQAGYVRRAVGQLPEHYRSVVILRHYENLKFREIADVLEIPEGTVKSRMAEALTILNQSLKRSMKEPGGGALNRASRSRPKESLVL
jgi:RNA polymerase sigma-70 factor (ECF subfamily)